MRYFINPKTKSPTIVGNDTPTYLNRILSEKWPEITVKEYEKIQKESKLEIKPTYEQLIQTKLVAHGYDINRQIAIICNKDIDIEHMKEIEEMQKVREECKAAAKKEIKK